MLTIDLNCDMGEGMPHDVALMPLISSANIACGGHAGDADTMRRTIELALKFNVAVGAHPSYPDRKNFGRKDLVGLSLRPEDIPSIIAQQILQLEKICLEFGTPLHHIKPHGALYNRAAADSEISALICDAVKQIDPLLMLYGLSGSKMKSEAAKSGLKFVSEVFADRTYQEGGILTPRTQPYALIESQESAIKQVLSLVKNGFTTSIEGFQIPVLAETVCLHGDSSKAVEFARLINETFKEENIKISAPEWPK